MVINMSNPFDDELDGEDKSREELEIQKVIESFRSSSVEGSEDEEWTSSVKELIEEEKNQREIVRNRNKRKAEKRKEARKLKKIEKIAKLMPSIREKFSDKIQEIVDRYVSEGKSEKEVLVRMMQKEWLYLQFATANQYRSYEESLEEHYLMFLNSFKMER